MNSERNEAGLFLLFVTLSENRTFCCCGERGFQSAQRVPCLVSSSLHFRSLRSRFLNPRPHSLDFLTSLLASVDGQNNVGVRVFQNLRQVLRIDRPNINRPVLARLLRILCLSGLETFERAAAAERSCSDV